MYSREELHAITTNVRYQRQVTEEKNAIEWVQSDAVQNQMKTAAENGKFSITLPVPLPLSTIAVVRQYLETCGFHAHWANTGCTTLTVSWADE